MMSDINLYESEFYNSYTFKEVPTSTSTVDTSLTMEGTQPFSTTTPTIEARLPPAGMAGPRTAVVLGGRASKSCAKLVCSAFVAHFVFFI